MISTYIIDFDLIIKKHNYIGLFFLSVSFHSKKCTFFLHSSLSARFDFSRVRIAFSGLLAFTWGFSNWFYSGLKKRSWKKIENFWSKIDFKIEIEKFSKISKKSRFFRFFHFFSKIFEKSKIEKSWISIEICQKIFEKNEKK